MTQLSEWLKQHQITEVECVTPDFTGIARGKIVPRENSAPMVCACPRRCWCKP